MITALLLVSCPLAWTLLDLLRKLLAPYGKATPLTLLLVVGQAPLFLVWVAVSAGWAIDPGYWFPGLASVVLNIFANLFFMQSMKLSPMSATLPLLSLTPAFSTLMAMPMLGEVPLWTHGLGVAIVVVGALLLNASPESGFSPAALWRGFVAEKGSPYMLAVAFLWSLAPVLDKLALRHASMPMHGVILTGGISLGLAGLLAVRGRLGEIAELRPATPLLVAAAGASLLALGLQFAAIQLVWVGLLETLKRAIGSVLALVLGRLVFRESFHASRILAVLVMSVGVALVLL